MVKRSLSMMVIGMLLHGFGQQNAQAQTVALSDVDMVRRQVKTFGTGERSKVVVKIKDGRKLRGYISQTGEESFTVANSKTRQTTTVAYADVKQVKKRGWSSVAKIAIGVGIGAGVAIAVVGGMVAAKGLGGFCPLGCR